MTKDHVLARQFFPREENYLLGPRMPIVPGCRKCNSEKQRLEDFTGTFFQFFDGGEASRKVLEGRVPRTLAKNLKLKRILQEALKDIWLLSPSGIYEKRLAFEINDECTYVINSWYKMMTQGLFFYEKNVILPISHSLYVIKPGNMVQFCALSDLIRSSKESVEKSFASGEFRYSFSQNTEENLTLWMFTIKSIEMFVVTADQNTPASLIEKLREVDYR